MAQIEFSIPKEIIAIDDKRRAMDDLRNLYVKLPFGFRKAKKCAFEGQRLRGEFWAKIYKMYPELKGIRLEYVEGFDFVTKKPSS